MDPLSAATTRSSHQQLRRRTSHHLIRTAHGHEAPQIHALLERAFVDERDYFAETLLDEVERSMAHGDEWLILEKDGEAIGVVCVYRDRLTDRSGRIGQLAVEQAFRHTSARYGRQLIQIAEERLRAQGCNVMTVGVLDFKPPWLSRFYVGLGYQATQRIDGKDLDPPAVKPCRLYVMQKRTAPATAAPTQRSTGDDRTPFGRPQSHSPHECRRSRGSDR